MTKFEMKEVLQNGIATVIFEKSDGTIREMKCTLLTEYIPTPTNQLLQESENRRAENPNTLAVWDLENNGWRSFRIESVKEIR